MKIIQRSVADFYNCFYLFGTDLTEGMTFTRSGNEYTLANIAGVSATFDVAEDTIYTSDFESFAVTAYTLLIEGSGGVDSNYPFIKLTGRSEPADPSPVTLRPGDY